MKDERCFAVIQSAALNDSAGLHLALPKVWWCPSDLGFNLGWNVSLWSLFTENRAEVHHICVCIGMGCPVHLPVWSCPCTPRPKLLLSVLAAVYLRSCRARADSSQSHHPALVSYSFSPSSTNLNLAEDQGGKIDSISLPGCSATSSSRFLVVRSPWRFAKECGSTGPCDRGIYRLLDLPGEFSRIWQKHLWTPHHQFFEYLGKWVHVCLHTLHTYPVRESCCHYPLAHLAAEG